MNAAALPMDHAPFLMVSVNEDGSMLRCPFTSRALADATTAARRSAHPDREIFVTDLGPVLPGLRGQV